MKYTEEHGQLHIAPDQTPGLPMVISQEVARPMVGRMRYLYEATNLIKDHVSAADFYADRFGLDASKFVPIASNRLSLNDTNVPTVCPLREPTRRLTWPLPV